ncbi:MAG: DUF2971 domain-containing protein [Candidatus Paceibacterota bacterium]
MKVYKYRGIDYFERDLESLEENYFWAPTYNNLNDPFEALVLDDDFKKQSRMLEQIFGKISNFSKKEVEKSASKVIKLVFKMGIYSLSKTYNHELLWAHYGGSHKGFCIEYDLDKLVDNIYQKIYYFDVEYSLKPPSLVWNDLLVQDEQNELSILKKIAGTKSKSWDYEEEIRLVTDESEKQFYEYDAVSAIYFGHRMSEENKDLIMSKMKGRGIKYFDIRLKENSYKFKREEVLNKYKSGPAYLGTISQSQEFQIISKSYNRFVGKASINIKLSRKITKNQLQFVAADIRSKVFPMAERIFMMYYLPDMEINSGAWATSHFSDGKINVIIHGLTEEKEKDLLENFRNDKRDIVGRWFDNTPFASSVRVLFKNEGNIYFETIFADGSSFEEEMIASKTPEGTRYDYVDDGGYGEYFIVNDRSDLLFVSENGVFRTIPLYESAF